VFHKLLLLGPADKGLFSLVSPYPAPFEFAEKQKAGPIWNEAGMLPQVVPVAAYRITITWPGVSYSG